MINPNKGKIVSVADQQDLRKLLRKFETQKEAKPQTPKDLEYAVRLIEHYQSLQETGGHLVKLFQPGPLGIDKYPNHKAFFDATARYKEVLFRAANRCFAEGTLVATPSGPVKIEELRVGDDVYDCHGNPTKVVDVHDNGVSPTVSLVHRGMEYARCTPEHEFDALNKRHNPYKRERVKAENLGHKKVPRRIDINAPLGAVDEPHAYVIGAFLGDGSCTVSTNTRLYFASEDNLVPNKIAEILGTTAIFCGGHGWRFKVDKPFNHHDNWLNGRLGPQKIVDLEVIKTWNRKSLLNFVAGLIDTDGSLANGKTGQQLSLTNQSRSIIDAFCYAVLALWNEQCRLKIDDREKYVKGPCYVASVTNFFSLKKICDELAPFLAHKRKADFKNCFGKRSLKGSLKLSPIPSTECRVYDITVAHSEHFFLLANGLCVSNCGKTESGGFAASSWTTGLYPDWWEGRIFNKPTFGWVVGRTYEDVKAVLQEKLLGPPPYGTGLIPKDCILDVKIRPNSGGCVDTVFILHKPTGKVSRIKFKCYEQGAEAFQGAAPDWIWMDEEPTGKDAMLLWNQAYVRLTTTNGSMLITFTPLSGWTQMVKDFSETSVDLTPKN